MDVAQSRKFLRNIAQSKPTFDSVYFPRATVKIPFLRNASSLPIDFSRELFMPSLVTDYIKNTNKHNYDIIYHAYMKRNDGLVQGSLQGALNVVSNAVLGSMMDGRTPTFVSNRIQELKFQHARFQGSFLPKAADLVRTLVFMSNKVALLLITTKVRSTYGQVIYSLLLPWIPNLTQNGTNR